MKTRQRIKPRTNKKNRRPLAIGLAVFFILAGTATLSFGTSWLDFIPKLLTNHAEQTIAQETGLIARDKDRGNIYDRRFTELAASYRTNSIYARPLEIVDPTLTAEKLAGILRQDQAAIIAALKSEQSFVWLQREINAAKAKQITDLNLPGIHLADESKRIYPNHHTASHVIGFAKKGQGLDGLEFHYDNILQDGTIIQNVPTAELHNFDQLGSKGAHLILTLDLQAQRLLEQHLAKILKKTGASSGKALLMSPKTGDILALANLPDYDPNLFWDFNEQDRRNRIISEPLLPVEPEPVASSAASDLNDPADLTHFQDGVITPDRQKIRLGYPETVGPLAASNLLDLLDLNHEFDIDLPNKIAALPNPESRNSQSSISALQLLAAFSCVLNGGHEIKPHLLARIRALESGREINTHFSETSRPIIQPAAREKIMAILATSSRPGPVNSLLLEALQTAAPPSTGPSNLKPRHTDQNSENTVPAGNLSHVILLAAAPRQNPELALLINLQQAKIPMDKQGHPPSFLLADSMVLPELLKLTRAPSPVPSPSLWDFKSAEYYAKAELSSPAPQKPASHAKKNISATMPAVTGISLRKGLQILQQYNLNIKTSGSGIITAQIPGPGSRITMGDDCVLKLHMEQSRNFIN